MFQRYSILCFPSSLNHLVVYTATPITSCACKDFGTILPKSTYALYGPCSNHFDAKEPRSCISSSAWTLILTRERKSRRVLYTDSRSCWHELTYVRTSIRSYGRIRATQVQQAEKFRRRNPQLHRHPPCIIDGRKNAGMS